MVVPFLCFLNKPRQSRAKQPGLHCSHCSCDDFQMLQTHKFGAWPRSQPSVPDKSPVPVLYYTAGPFSQPQLTPLSLQPAQVLGQGTQPTFLALTLNILCGLRRLLAVSEPYFLGYKMDTKGSIMVLRTLPKAGPQARQQPLGEELKVKIQGLQGGSTAASSEAQA